MNLGLMEAWNLEEFKKIGVRALFVPLLPIL
jgi:hypothetical protein